MPDREEVLQILKAVRGDIRKHGVQNYHLLLEVCRFVNSLFCPCRYVEYWVFDMGLGQNICNTELGFEMAGIDTVEKLVEFLYSKIHAQKDEQEELITQAWLEVKGKSENDLKFSKHAPHK